MTRPRHAAAALALLVPLLVGGSAPARDGRQPALTRVTASHVCMMNDKRFPEPQIPVVVAGRTYFGCCEMCKARLENDPGARTAIDPVSRAQVDKASAVIGATPDGRVFYFETDANLTAFAPPPIRN